MLSLFPEFLDYWFLGIAIVRVTIALMFMSYGYEKLFRYTPPLDTTGHPTTLFVRFLGVLEFFFGASLFIGFVAQLAGPALALSALTSLLLKKNHNAVFHHERGLYILLCVLASTFFIFGAGAFAVDLPL